MAPPRNPTPRPVQRTLPAQDGLSAQGNKITSDGGWSHLMRAMSRTAPARLNMTDRIAGGMRLLRTKGL